MSTPKLNILGTTWNLVLVDQEEIPSKDCLGFMDTMGHRIMLDGDMFPDWRLYILLHEVLHVLVFMGHLQFLKTGGHDDEMKIDAVASLMANFLTTNKPVLDNLIARSVE